MLLNFEYSEGLFLDVTFCSTASVKVFSDDEMQKDDRSKSHMSSLQTSSIDFVQISLYSGNGLRGVRRNNCIDW